MLLNSARFAWLILLPVLAAPLAPAAQPAWEGRASIAFEHAGRAGVLIAPEQAADGRPWLWSAAPLEPGVLSQALLDKGFHLAWMDAGDLYGNADALGHWDAFYAWAVSEQGLGEKPALSGKGADALVLFNWAAQNLDRVACLISETPWLRPQEFSDAEPAVWKAVCEARAVSPDATAEAFPGAPLDLAAAFGAAETPLLFWHGAKETANPASARQVHQFYDGYRRAGRGPFEHLEALVEPDAQAGGIALHLLYYVLKHTDGLTAAPPEEPINGAPQWTPADFAGGTNVYALDGALIIEEGRDMTGVRWLGALPGEEYEITLEAMRLSGGDFFCGLTAPWQDSAFSLILGGWGGTCVGISSLDWLDAYHNETARFRTFHAHRWYPVRLRVTGERIQAWVDREQVVDVEVGERNVDIRWELSPTKPLGIATWRTTGAIRKFRVVAL